MPSTGTWTQRDTLDAPLDPNNANRYAFAGNDPVNNSDPSGSIIIDGSNILTSTVSVFTTAAVGVALGSVVALACVNPIGIIGCSIAALSVGVASNAPGNASAEVLTGQKRTFDPT